MCMILWVDEWVSGWVSGRVPVRQRRERERMKRDELGWLSVFRNSFPNSCTAAHTHTHTHTEAKSSLECKCDMKYDRPFTQQ